MSEKNIFGWYDNCHQVSPSFDPGLDVDCPFCDKQLEADPVHLKTISVIDSGGDKSYFYRAHRLCYVTASVERVKKIESKIVDCGIVQ